MRKLRVGIWLSSNFKPEVGGGFSYYNQLIKKMIDYEFRDAEIVFLSQNNEVDHVSAIRKHNIQWVPYKEPKRNRLFSFIERKFNHEKINNLRKNRIAENKKSLKRELDQYVDIIYYPLPICIFPDFPYIYTLWDLGHLSMYAFPEVSMNNIFEDRKYHHDLYPAKALMIFAESNSGKKEIGKYLQINEDRIKVIPLFPSEIVNENIIAIQPKTINKDLFFIHYPAQYWAHKNHYNLLQAFKQVIVKYPLLKLILTGSDRGNKDYIKSLIMEWGLTDHIIDLGFVATEELKWLYQNSKGLVMPTFLGPTNMPLLEAAVLGCPVACSKLEGHEEQLGSYGYYFDPKNVEEISSSISKMIEDGKNDIKRSYKNNFNIDNAFIEMDKAFSEIMHIRFCWGIKDDSY